jgi:uracil-xanthine permease
MTGTIVMMIGFNLAPNAVANFQAQSTSAWVTVIAVVLITVLFRGIIGRLSILLGVAAGYITAIIQGDVDFAAIGKAPWIGLPEFHAPTPQWNVLGMFLPVVLVLIAENVGHVKSVALMTGKNYDKSMGRALLADGVATTVAGLGGGSGTTTYAENIGVMAATKVYSTAVYWVAAATALVLSLFPKFGAAIATVPDGVIGGAGVVLYGMIGLLGARIWIENKVDFASPVNLFPAAVALILGIGNVTFHLGAMELNGIAVGTVTAFALYHLMRLIARWRGTDVAA